MNPDDKPSPPLTLDEAFQPTGVATHRMLPGSHERPSGAECVCGGAWSRWDDECDKEATAR